MCSNYDLTRVATHHHVDILVPDKEINQILLKMYFVHILLTFMYLATLYQKTKDVNKSKSTRCSVATQVKS